MARTIEIASNAAASSWTDLTGILPWQGSRWGGEAHHCEVGTGSGFDLDDDAGSVTLPAKRVLRATEDATSPDTLLFSGRVSDKNLARGTKFTGDAKAFDASLDDGNSHLYGIPVDGWSRPSETDYERIQALGDEFLAGYPRASTDLDYTTYVPNTHTVTLPAKVYDTTDVAGVIKDCSLSAGKQAFVTVDDELFYDLDTSTAYAATLSITDSSPNLTSSFPPIEPTGSEDGSEFVSGATLRYGTSSEVSDVRSSAESAHDYWRTTYWDTDAKASTAAQRLATMLDNQSIEELRYTCGLRLLASQVDKIKYGHTVSFRSAAAGVTSPVTLRVASLYWEPIGVDVYIAHLELGVPEKLAPRTRKGAPPTSVEPFVCIPPDYTVRSRDNAEDLAAVYPNHDPGGNNVFSTDAMYLYIGATYEIDYLVFHPVLSTGLGATLAIETGTALGTPIGSGAPLTSGNPPGGTLGTGPWVYMGDLAQTCNGGSPTDVPTWTTTWVSDMTGYVLAALITKFCATTDAYASSISARIRYITGPDPRFEDLTPCSNGEPISGQAVHDAPFVGDGTTTSFTTQDARPYRPGTLQLIVNGLDWTNVPNVVTETDPTAGTYDLLYPFPLGATVLVRFVSP